MFFSAIAQHSISVRSGISVGSGAANSYLSPNLKISNRVSLPQVCVPLKIHYRFLEFFGLEAGYQWSAHSINAVNPRFRKTPSATDTKADDSVPVVLQGRKLYHSLCLSAYGYLPFGLQKDDNDLEMSLYIGAGYLINRRIGNSLSSDNFLHQPDNFVLDLNAQYVKQINAAYVEFGLNYDGGKKNTTKLVFFAGVKYFYYAPIIMNGSYNVYSKNILMDHDDLHTNYGHVMFSFEMGRNILYKHKKLSQLIPIKLHFPSYDKILHDSLHAQKLKNDSLVIVRKQAEKQAALEAMGSRPVQTTHILNIHTPTLTLKLWDKQIVDGDIVSLNLNGRWILENYNLTAHKYEVVITLDPGENNLVLYAISEGRRKSCTVAVIFDDGHKQEQLLLDSDFKKSSAVQINYIP